MATKVGSSSRLQGCPLHEKLGDNKYRTARCKTRKSSKLGLVNDLIKDVIQHGTEQPVRTPTAAPKLSRGAARVAEATLTAAAGATRIAADAATTPARLSPPRRPQRAPVATTVAAGQITRSASPLVGKKTQGGLRLVEQLVSPPPVLPCVLRERPTKTPPFNSLSAKEPSILPKFETVYDCNTGGRYQEQTANNVHGYDEKPISQIHQCAIEDGLKRNRLYASCRDFPIQVIESQNSSLRTQSTSSIKRRRDSHGTLSAQSSFKIFNEISKALAEQFPPREPITRPSRRQFRSLARAADLPWDPATVSPNTGAVPAEKPDAVADAAGDAESRAARNFAGVDMNANSRRSRGPDGPSPAPPPPSRASDRRGISPAHQRTTRGHREDRRYSKSWQQQSNPISPMENISGRSTTAQSNRETSPKTFSRKANRPIAEPKYNDASSRESSPRKEACKYKTYTRSGGTGSCLAAGSNFWDESQDGGGKKRKISRRKSSSRNNKSRQTTDLTSPKNISSKPNSLDDATFYKSARHNIDGVEVWEDLIVEKWDKKSGTKHHGKKKFKKNADNASDSTVDSPIKKLEKLERQNNKKEKLSFHMKQISRETLDKEVTKIRNTEKSRKSKELSKINIVPEQQVEQKLKGNRQKMASAENQTRYKPPTKVNSKSKEERRAERSIIISREGTVVNEHLLGKVSGVSMKDNWEHKSTDRPRSPSLLAEGAPTSYITLGDATIDHESGRKSHERWTVLESKTSSKHLQGNVWSPLPSDECCADSRPETRLSRTSRSTCRGGSGDDILHPRKRGSALSTVCSLRSSDTCDSPNRALTPGLSIEERVKLETSQDVLVAYKKGDSNVRVRSSTNPRLAEDSGYSARSRSVSAGTGITRIRHKKLSRKRRGTAVGCVRCNENSTRALKLPPASTKHDVTIKSTLSSQGSRPRKSSPSAAIAWERTYYITSTRKTITREPKVKKIKSKIPASEEPKHALGTPQVEVRMPIDDSVDPDGSLNDLDWKLDFAMEAALRVAGLRESDSPPDSSPTAQSSQENESQESKEEYADSKESTWCQFVRRPLSAVPEEDSHCSSSNKDIAKSEFDLEMMLKHVSVSESEEEKAINAVLNEIFRDGGGETVVPEYERTATDTEAPGISPTCLSTLPRSSDSSNMPVTDNDLSTLDLKSQIGSPTIVQGKHLNPTISSPNSDIPQTTDSDNRSDDIHTPNASTDSKNDNKYYDLEKSSVKSIFVVNQEQSFIDLAGNGKESSTNTKESSSTNRLDVSLTEDISTLYDQNGPLEDSRLDETESENISNITTCEKGRDIGEINNSVSQSNISKPGMFIALDTLLKQYEKSYSSSSSEVPLHYKIEKTKSISDEMSKDSESLSVSHLSNDNLSDNTSENIKSIPKTDTCPCLIETKVICNDMLPYDRDDTVSVKPTLNRGNYEANDNVGKLKERKYTPSRISSSSSRKTINVIAHEVIKKSTDFCFFPLPKETTTLSPTKDILPLPDRFVVQEGGTFKEPSTPFKFVLTVNLHGPTILDSSVEESDEFDRESLSSQSTSSQSTEDILPQKFGETEICSIKSEAQNAISAHNIDSKSNIFDLTSPVNPTENITNSHEEKTVTLSFPTNFPSGSEVSDSDHPSTIPSVLNLEDVDDERCVSRENESVSRPNVEIIERISNICRQWRRSIESLCCIDNMSPNELLRNGNEFTKKDIHNKSLALKLPKEVSFHNLKEDSLPENKIIGTEWKPFEEKPGRIRKRVSLKLFSDWDVINHIIDQSGVEGYLKAYISKERVVEDIVSNVSSIHELSSSSISYKGSLKRKRPSRSSRNEWRALEYIKEFKHTSPESSLSSLSPLISISDSENASKGLPLFHYLPRLVRKEMAKDRKALIKSYVRKISSTMTNDTSAYEDQVSDSSPLSHFDSTDHASSNNLLLKRDHTVVALNSEQDNCHLDVKRNYVPDAADETISNDVFYLQYNKLLDEDRDLPSQTFPLLSEEISHDTHKKDLGNIRDIKENQIATGTIQVIEDNNLSMCCSHCHNECIAVSNIDDLAENQPITLIHQIEMHEGKDVFHEATNTLPETDHEQFQEFSLDEDQYFQTLSQIITPPTLSPKQSQTDTSNINICQNILVPVASFIQNQCILHNKSVSGSNLARDNELYIKDDENNIESLQIESTSVSPNNDFKVDEHLVEQNRDTSIQYQWKEEECKADPSHMNRAILEGVALTVLLDAASIINRMMNNTDKYSERKLEPSVTRGSDEIEETEEVSPIQSLRALDSKVRILDSKVKDLDSELQNLKEKSTDNILRSTVTKGKVSNTRGSVSESTETDSKNEAFSYSMEETSSQQISTESVESVQTEDAVVLIPANSRNISLYITNPVWEDVGFTYADSSSGEKTDSSATQHTSNEDAFASLLSHPTNEPSIQETLERMTITQTSNSDWETISQSVETVEVDKDTEGSKSKELESLWRRDSHLTRDWDTSTETLGLLRPMASFASAPSVHGAEPQGDDAAQDDEMKLVFMRKDVRFTESDDSAVRCYTWANASDNVDVTLTPETLCPSRKSEAVQVCLPESSLPLENYTPPASNEVPNDFNLRIPLHPDHLSDVSIPLRNEISELKALPSHQSNYEYCSERNAGKHPQQHSQEPYYTNEAISEVESELEDVRNEIGRGELTLLNRENVLDTDFESSLDSESDLEAEHQDALEQMSRQALHRWMEQRLTGAWPFQRHHWHFRRPMLRTLLSAEEKSTERRRRTDMTNNIIAIVCFVFAVAVMNSILLANNIIIFK